MHITRHDSTFVSRLASRRRPWHRRQQAYRQEGSRDAVPACVIPECQPQSGRHTTTAVQIWCRVSVQSRQMHMQVYHWSVGSRYALHFLTAPRSQSHKMLREPLRTRAPRPAALQYVTQTLFTTNTGPLRGRLPTSAPFTRPSRDRRNQANERITHAQWRRLQHWSQPERVPSLRPLHSIVYAPPR